jgi:glutathione S-transferase
VYNLYYAPRTCSLAVQIKLQASGIPYEAVAINRKQKQHLTKEFTKINSLKRVPVLSVNGAYINDAMPLLLLLEHTHYLIHRRSE